MIDVFTLEWVSQILRWLHVITAIAWIGSSFYFIHLDLSLRKREAMPEGVGGEAWQVHGGGFYHMQKYVVAPPHLPKELTWFKWESYATWISGFFLLVWIYYLQADLFTIDPAVLPLAPWQAAAIGIGGLVAGWFVYDALCKSPLGRNGAALGAVLLVFIVAASYLFSLLFSGRAAFLHTGALIATWMSASVLLVIIPNQKIVVADLIAGRTPDPKLGMQAKQRSVHNNYLTLPVVFLMLSSHYPLSWSSTYAPAIVGLIVVGGAVVRHFFNSRHAHQGSPWWTWAVAAACVALAAWLSVIGRPTLETAQISDGRLSHLITPGFEEAMFTLQGRCSMCHATEPVWAGIASPPKGVRLETSDDILRHAAEIRIQAVETRAMPPNNVTEMTIEERRVVAQWLEELERRTGPRSGDAAPGRS